jgi:restriction endonuclease S subunit
VFSLSIGKRVLQEDLTETGIHVYSANVFEPMGLIDEKLLTDFDNEYIVWGIDGDWMVNIFPKGYEFYPTDHCGVMQVDKNIINPKYMAYLLEKEGARFGFSRTYRASLDRIKNISIEVPHINTQNEKMREVENLEKKIRKLEETQIDLNSEISNIIDSYLI